MSWIQKLPIPAFNSLYLLLTNKPGDVVLTGSELLVKIREVGGESDRASPDVLRQVIRSILKNMLDSDSRVLDDLVRCEEFIPLLVSSLKPECATLHRTVLFIIIPIVHFETESKALKKLMAASGLYTALITLLTLEDGDVDNCRMAVHILSQLSPWPDTPQGKELSNWTTIVPVLSSLVEKPWDPENPPSEELKDAWFRDIAMTIHCWVEAVKTPSSNCRKELPNLLAKLFKSGCKEKYFRLAMCLCLSVSVDKRLTSNMGIIEAGIVPFLIPILDHRMDEFVVDAATLAISNIVMSGTDRVMLEFFKAIGGAVGMKDFYRGRFTAGKEAEMAAVLKAFLDILLSSLEGRVGSEIIAEVMASGFFYSLVTCLQPRTPQNCQLLALKILTQITSDINASRADKIVEAEAIPLLINLIESDKYEVCSLAFTCLGNLLPVSVQYRKDFMSLGGLPKLFRLTRLYKKKTKLVTDLLKGFELLLEMQEPRMKLIKELPECLKLILDPVNIKRLKKEDSAGAEFIQRKVKDCARLILKYGEEGVEMVRGHGVMSDAEITDILNAALIN